MCGEIDQEITVPELVKEDTLCPHQDFVYMCSPTAEEAERLKRFEETKWDYIHHLIVDPYFQTFVAGSKVLKGDISSDLLLEDPKYLSAILIYMAFSGANDSSLFAKFTGNPEASSIDLLLAGDTVAEHTLSDTRLV